MEVVVCYAGSDSPSLLTHIIFCRLCPWYYCSFDLFSTFCFVYCFFYLCPLFSQPGPGGLVHTQCKPCAHAILDVWSEGEIELEKMKRLANYSGSLDVSSEIGIEGGHGIYTLASVRNKDPELATFRGLQDPAKAAQFTQVLTLGQYCSKLKAGLLTAPNIGTEYAAEEYDGGTVSVLLNLLEC